MYIREVLTKEFSETFDYRLKDITKLDDFNQVSEMGNSSFHKAINR